MSYWRPERNFDPDAMRRDFEDIGRKLKYIATYMQDDRDDVMTTTRSEAARTSAGVIQALREEAHATRSSGMQSMENLDKQVQELLSAVQAQAKQSKNTWNVCIACVVLLGILVVAAAFTLWKIFRAKAPAQRARGTDTGSVAGTGVDASAINDMHASWL